MAALRRPGRALMLGGGIGTAAAASVEAGPGDHGYATTNPQRGRLTVARNRGRLTGILGSGVVRAMIAAPPIEYATQSLGRPVVARPARASHVATLLSIEELSSTLDRSGRMTPSTALAAALADPHLYRRDAVPFGYPVALAPTSRLAAYRPAGAGTPAWWRTDR